MFSWLGEEAAYEGSQHDAEPPGYCIDGENHGHGARAGELNQARQNGTEVERASFQAEMSPIVHVLMSSRR